jgi:hypothetical protein
MRYLLENPWPILFAGLFVFGVLVAVWTRFQKRMLLVAALLVAVLTAGALWLEITTVTPGEEVESTLRQIAVDLESNRLPVTLSHLSTRSQHLRRQAESILEQVTVKSVSIKRNLRVNVSADSNRATANFNAVATLEDHTGMWGHEIVPRYFEVDFIRENGRWRVLGYKDYDPREGM